MNNLASAPLVIRSTGGKGGGGTVLTTAGVRLVATYRVVARENERFLKRINSRAGQPARELELIGRLGMLTSARAVQLFVTRLDELSGELLIRAERQHSDGRGALYAFRVNVGQRLLAQGRASLLLEPPA